MLVLLVLVMPTTAGRMSLASSTYLCSGYQGCEAAGYGNAGYRQVSSTMYWRMYAGHNCTNYVAYRLIQSGMPDVRPWQGSGNASNWGVAMASITDQVPTVGSIAWYKPHVTPAGSAGHVAYVEQVVSDTEIIVSEDYWGGDFYWRRITKTGGGWPSGFIHFNDRVVQPTSPPTIAGSPMVGAPLEVAAGAWTPAPTSITYRWLADGAEIPGATGANYVPTPDVKGKALTAEVTAQLSGYTPGEAALATAPVAPGTFQKAQLPTIQGAPEVGTTLTLTPTAWAPQPTKAKTQWYADGAPLSGATGSTLTLTRDQIGKKISARVIASAKGYKKSRSTAPETAPVTRQAGHARPPVPDQGRGPGGGPPRREDRPRPAERRDGHVPVAPRRSTHRQGHAPHLHGPSGGHGPRPVRRGHVEPAQLPRHDRDPRRGIPRHDRPRDAGPHRGQAWTRGRRHPRQGRRSAASRPARSPSASVDGRSRASSSTAGRASSYVTSGRARSPWSCAMPGPTSCSRQSRARA